MSKKSKRPQAKLPRGFADASGTELVQRQEMIDTILPVYRLFGFQPLETPVLEYLDALGKHLPDKDQPGEGVFALRDDDDQWMALRYDLTAPLARYVAQNRNDITLPYRRFQAGPVFRQDKPGPGRYRQFYQCDFDTVGSRSMAVDAEVCAVLATGLEQLGIEPGDYLIRVNDRKVLNGILTQAGLGDDAAAVRAHVLRSVDKLDRVGLDGVRFLLGEGREDESGDFTRGVGLGPDQIDQILGFVDAGGGSRADVLDRLGDIVGEEPEGKEGIHELATIDSLLSSMGLEADKVCFDPTVVRGLEYYTGPVFEAELTFETDQDGDDGKGDAVRSFGSIAAGGRYDDLVKRFTGQDVPACGASIGVDRLLAALRSLGTMSTTALDGPVVVTVMDKERLADYQAMVAELRRAGISSELYLGNKKIGDQLKYADRRRSPAAVIAGSDEFGAGTVVVKNLAYGKEVSQEITNRDEWLNAADVQQTIDRTSLVETVASLVTRRKIASH